MYMRISYFRSDWTVQRIDEKLLEDIVRTLKIGEKLENLPEELSGGQQQRSGNCKGVNGKAGSTFV